MGSTPYSDVFLPVHHLRQLAFPPAKLFLKENFYVVKENRQDFRPLYVNRRKLASLCLWVWRSCFLFSILWEAIGVAQSQWDWTLQQLAGLGMKDPRKEVPCLSSQQRLALTWNTCSSVFSLPVFGAPQMTTKVWLALHVS